MMKRDLESQADEFNSGPRNSTISGNRAVTTRDSLGQSSDMRQQSGGLEGIPGEVVGICSRKWQRKESHVGSRFHSSIFAASIFCHITNGL